MPAPKGNTYWTFRDKHGRNPIFKNPDELWDQCVAYFEWVIANPLQEEVIYHNNGKITRTSLSKMRAMTITGLCLYLGITLVTWGEYCKREDYAYVTTRAKDVIYQYKFEGAAADFLNPNIIARDLGLKDHKDLSSEDGTMSPKIEIVRPES
jgi:hypothetical protein